jgi:hypothetical protein
LIEPRWRDSILLSLCGGQDDDGFQTAPAQLFYDFCLDDHVPADHLLRHIDRFLDLESVRTALKPFYSSIGRHLLIPS